VLLLGFSHYYLFWNNMLFSNIPALSFLLGGIYYFNQKSNIKYISSIFFAISISLRYEYAIYVVLVLLAYLILKRTKALKLIIITGFSIGFILIPIPILNHQIYGSYTSFGYTQKSYDLNAGKTIDYSSSDEGGIQGFKNKLLKRFGGQFNSSMPKNFITNYSEYLLALAPLLILLSTIGMLDKRHQAIRDPAILGLIFICIFTLLYFWTAAGYNGFGKSWLASSYTRYFLPASVLFAIFSAYALNKFLIKKIVYIAFVLVIYIIFSFSITLNSKLGLRAIASEKRENKTVNNMTSELPKNAIIISNFYSKAIIDRPVLIPNLTSQIKDDRLSKTAEIINKDKNFNKFYIFENTNHSSYLGVADYLQENNQQIELIDNIRNFYVINNE
jgi:hypothetical protein